MIKETVGAETREALRGEHKQIFKKINLAIKIRTPHPLKSTQTIPHFPLSKADIQ